MYEDPDHPERITRTVDTQDFTEDDRALLIALSDYEGSLSPCGFPINRAWHTDSDGWWERRVYKCFVCSAGEDQDQYHEMVVWTMPPDQELAPFELDVTTETRDERR